jgi:hypothetical protein
VNAEKNNHKEVENTTKSVGSTSKPVRDMNAHWQHGHACMIPRHPLQGYGHSLEVKKCWEREMRKTLRFIKVDNHSSMVLLSMFHCGCIK